jgi:hypothetical protein
MKKKNLLNRINNKFSPSQAHEISKQPAADLHNMKLMMPSSQDYGVCGGQRELDDDELNELLNGKDEQIIPGAGLVQANWNVSGQVSTGGLRETTYVPTATTGFEDDYDGYQVQYDNGGKKKNNKMGTIREEAEENKSGGGSDTGYFSHEEGDFNSRD